MVTSVCASDLPRFGVVCVYGGLDSGSYSTLLLSPFVFIMFFLRICELRRVLSTIVKHNLLGLVDGTVQRLSLIHI